MTTGRIIPNTHSTLEARVFSANTTYQWTSENEQEMILNENIYKRYTVINLKGGDEEKSLPTLHKIY